ncbi:MAG: phosphoribosylformylglycinamidine synthase subunit PurS [Flavobacteriales bacterium]
MKYRAEIDIMPQKALLDPQGKTVSASLRDLGLESISNVRIGKHIRLDIEAPSKEEAGSLAEEACKKVLTNPVMESYHFEIHEIAEEEA